MDSSWKKSKRTGEIVMRKLQMQDYYPAPFWFLNHKLEREELRRQMERMKEQGITAFFLHPRAGLKTPYGSKEWFELMRFTVETADALGMKAWLYDEDPFPSGPAGGRIFLDHPEFAARGLVFHEKTPEESGRLSADLGEGRLLEALAVRVDDAGNVLESRDVFDEVGMIRSDFFQTLWPSPYYVHLYGKVKYPHYRAETFFPHLQIELDLPPGWKFYAVTAVTVEGTKYRYLPDNLNPECVRCFMELTHEKYKKYLGTYFGNAVPGIFTDETAVGAPFPWTDRFSSEFLRRRGSVPDGSYHRIFRGNSEAARAFRRDYWKTVQEMFIECFFLPVNEWCRSNGLALCGHGIGEEDPLATTNGMNIFALQKHVGIPGFDHITPNIPDGRKFKSLNLGGRLVSSAAEQLGEHRVQSECFGCNPYNFGHDGMKKNMHWLYALGVNWLVPHGFHYSYDGLRKDDAGKSFFFQSPDYERFHEFGQYAARLGFKLGESRSLAALCVAYPESVFRSLLDAERERAVELRETLYECIQFLMDHQIPFELADEATLAEASFTDGGFRCGLRCYDTLLLPFALDADFLAGFRRNHIPVLMFPDAGESLKERKPYFLSCPGGEAEVSRVMAQYRRTEEGTLLYLFNNQENRGCFRLAWSEPPAGGMYLYHAENDSYSALKADSVFALDAYDAVILEMRTSPLSCPDYEMPEERKADFSYLTTPQWDYVPALKSLVHVFRDWEMELGGTSFGKQRYARIREIAGSAGAYPKILRPRPIFDQAPRAPSIYPAEMSFRAEFELGELPVSLFLLAESETFAGSCEIRMNGTPVPALKRVFVYDPWNLACDVSACCHSGRNRLEIVWKSAGEFDGLESMIYLVENLNSPGGTGAGTSAAKVRDIS